MKRLLLFLLVITTGCAKWQDPYTSLKNALIIEPSLSTKADNGILTTDGVMVYTIGSVFVAENVSSDPRMGVYNSMYRFYQKKI